MHRATGVSNYLNSVTPVIPINRLRPQEEQEPVSQDWTKVQQQKRRVTITPKTEAQEELRMMKIEGIMDGVGICSATFAGIGILALLIYHVSWWVVPALASAIFLGWIIRYKED